MTEVFRPADSVAWVDEGERVVALRLEALAELPVTILGTGADIWRALADGASLVEIVDTVAALYDVEPEVVAADVEGMVRETVRLGVVTT